MTGPTRPLPVIEIFGPTIQGEGALIGHPTMFIRFGGCDYRCSWCDTMYAVDPAEVARNSTYMTSEEIVERLHQVAGGTLPEWVTLSGGNPVIHNLSDLLKLTSKEGLYINLETQGSFWRDWVTEVDLVTVSPKPPSSGMASKLDRHVLDRYMELPQSVLKIVIMGQADLDFAKEISRAYPMKRLFLQVGNPDPNGTEDKRSMLLTKLRWLVDTTLKDPEMKRAVILPQLHVLIWGNKRGV
ncbi:MAG: 7-carboxy-7-deazaguanine synthase QueE [Candidatus Bilamarchaeaceae archaeon]